MGRKRMRSVWRGFVALLAIGFASAAYLYLTLPDVRPLRTENPPTTAFIELRASQAIAKGETPRRVQRWISYSRISPSLVRAVLVTEDSKFWQHDGVDLEQIKESIETNIERMEFARGASTITQQLAKNLYLSPSKNPIRKLRELLIARRLEAELTKQRILEIYLNVIEWGNGIYGAEAAARTYFGKSASALSPQEAALMAAAITNARLFDVSRPSTRLRNRQAMVLRRMGGVKPPPVTTDPAEPATLPTVQEVPGPPPTIGAPVELPGEVIAPVKPLPAPPVKPGGEAAVHLDRIGLYSLYSRHTASQLPGV
jgi:monofunctional glycosyltransferase